MTASCTRSSTALSCQPSSQPMAMDASTMDPKPLYDEQPSKVAQQLQETPTIDHASPAPSPPAADVEQSRRAELVCLLNLPTSFGTDANGVCGCMSEGGAIVSLHAQKQCHTPAAPDSLSDNTLLLLKLRPWHCMSCSEQSRPYWMTYVRWQTCARHRTRAFGARASDRGSSARCALRTRPAPSCLQTSWSS